MNSLEKFFFCSNGEEKNGILYGRLVEESYVPPVPRDELRINGPWESNFSEELHSSRPLPSYSVCTSQVGRALLYCGRAVIRKLMMVFLCRL